MSNVIKFPTTQVKNKNKEDKFTNDVLNSLSSAPEVKNPWWKDSEPEPNMRVNHITGKMEGSFSTRRTEADNNFDRMQRIKNSLEKINQLMTELKKTTRKTEFED